LGAADVDLALHDLLAGLADILAADIEIAALADGRLVDRRHRQLGRLGADGRREGERRQQRAAEDARSVVHGFLPAAAFAADLKPCTVRA
jgi:hypothetical protein